MVEGRLRAVRNRVEAESGPRGYRAGFLRFALGRHAVLVVTENQLEGDGLLPAGQSGQEMWLAAARSGEGQPRGSLVVRPATIAAIGSQGPYERVREALQVQRRLGDAVMAR